MGMNEYQASDRIFPAKFIFLQNVVVCNGNDFPLALYNAALCSEIHMFGWSPDGECLILRRRYLHEIFPLSNSDSLERCHTWLVIKLWTHGFNQLLKEKLTSEDILEQVEYFFNPKFTRNEIFRQICTPPAILPPTPPVSVMLQSQLVECSMTQFSRQNSALAVNGMMTGCQTMPMDSYLTAPNNIHAACIQFNPQDNEGMTSNECNLFGSSGNHFPKESRKKSPTTKPSKIWRKLKNIQTSSALRSKLGFILPAKKVDKYKRAWRPLFSKPLKAPKRPYKVGSSLFSSRERREIIDNIFNPFHERRNIISEWFVEYRLQDDDEEYDSADEWELDEDALMDDIEKAYFAPANLASPVKRSTGSPSRKQSSSKFLSPRRSKVQFSKEFVQRFGSAYLRMKEEKKRIENEPPSDGQAAIIEKVDVAINSSYDLNYSNLYCSKKASEILSSSQQQSQIENAVNSII